MFPSPTPSSTPSPANAPAARAHTRPTSTRVRAGDLHAPADQAAVLKLLNLYASTLPGRMAPLSAEVNQNLIPALQQQVNCRLFLAEVPQSIVGMALCFVGFSTFKAKPLLNIHDLAVHPDFQARGIGSQLLDSTIAFAKHHNYCAVTLEVQASNAARRLYARHGFQVLDGIADEGSTLFGKLELC